MNSGEILSISYNNIVVKRDTDGKTENIFFEGLQKRVLSDCDEQLLKRLKRLEWTDGEFWERGINPIVCCDDCKNGLFSLFEEDTFLLDEKETCSDCGKWLCSDCVKSNGLCNNCCKKTLIRVLIN